jgi:hypothetical protein
MCLAGMQHVWGGDMCIEGFGGESLKEGDDLEDLGTDGSLILKWIKILFIHQLIQ